jgi:hypothetical protein
MTTTGEAGFFMQTFGLLSGLVLITNWHRQRTNPTAAPSQGKTFFKISDRNAPPSEGAGQPVV